MCLKLTHCSSVSIVNFEYVVAGEAVSAVNPFYATHLFLYPLETSENQRCCQGLQKEASGMGQVNNITVAIMIFTLLLY